MAQRSGPRTTPGRGRRAARRPPPPRRSGGGAGATDGNRSSRVLTGAVVVCLLVLLGLIGREALRSGGDRRVDGPAMPAAVAAPGPVSPEDPAGDDDPAGREPTDPGAGDASRRVPAAAAPLVPITI